ncbi:MAG: DUF4345 domain-containing protein [Litoreibacter sp.]|nr:DUF4345 domain-containing protein [Litoreibacter sp.]
MRFFTILCYFFAAIALITGASDLIQGLASQRAFGATLTDAGFADPMVDNVFRFFSGLWFGVGVMFILFVRDLNRYKPAMIALLGMVILGGLGRILSIWQYGLPDHSMGVTLIFLGLLAEVIISPIMLWWLASWYRTSG